MTSNEKFYISHSGNAAYYLTNDNGKKSIVVVNIQSMHWEIYDISMVSNSFKNLDDSSLISENSILSVVVPANPLVRNPRKVWQMLNLWTGKVIWQVKDAERIYFTGEHRSGEEKFEEDLEGDSDYDKASYKNRPPEEAYVLMISADKVNQGMQDGADEDEA